MVKKRILAFALFLLVTYLPAAEDVPTRKVVCWGDSLTAPHPGCYPDSLSALLGPRYEIVNCGVGGESTPTIMGRQGAYPMLLAHDVKVFCDSETRYPKFIGNSDLPAFVSSLDTSVVTPLIQDGWEEGGPAAFNPCRIGGHLFRVRSEAHNWMEKSFQFEYNYYIEPLEPVEGTFTLSKWEPVETAAMRDLRGAYAYIFFMGQCGGFDSAEDLVRQYQAMVRYGGSERYLIVGFHIPNYAIPTISAMKEMEKTLKKAFGDHYINNREYMVRHGLKEAGLIATEEDKSALKEGKVPPSLMKDGVHFTDAAYGILAGEIVRRFKKLKY